MGFFKSIFSNKSSTDKTQFSWSSTLFAQTQKAIQILSENDSSIGDEEIMKLFSKDGISQNNGIEILIFLPIAFLRQWLSPLNWQDTYKEIINNNEPVEKKFSETVSFQVIWEVTKNYFQGAPQSDTILKIATRSSEFDAINQFLNDGGEVKDIEFAQTVILR